MLMFNTPGGGEVASGHEVDKTLRLDRVTYAPPGSGNPTPLVSDISFDIAPGEIVVITGPNGAGKTTLVRLIAGLLAPSRGDIRVNDRLLGSMGHGERARFIAYVGQSEEPDGRLLVEEYASLGSLPFQRFLSGALQSDRAAGALAAVGLASLARRRMGQLSGGERQKAKIARAICQQPSLFILDEPTNHLDPGARGELLSLIAAMGICVVVALHDLTLIDAFADKVAIISDSRLIAFGPPREVLTPDRMMDVFGVEMHRFDHPLHARKIPALDILVDRDVVGRILP